MWSQPARSPSCDFETDKLLLKLQISVAADPNAIAPVIEEIMGIVRKMKCSEGKEYEIELALTEAMANAVVHGCKSDPSKTIECCVACDEQRGMLIIVRDPGPGFDSAKLPSCTHGENIFSDHGRGIFLINQLMDEVRFEKGGTEIHMIKR